MTVKTLYIWLVLGVVGVGFRFTRLKAAVLEVLDVPRLRGDVARLVGRSESSVSQCLKRLWMEGRVLRSDRPVSVSFVESRPGVGRYWKRVSGHLWIRSDSPLLTPSGVVEVELPHTEKYTLKETVRKVNVRFVPYREEPAKEARISQEAVLEWFRSRSMGAVSREVADHFGVPVARATMILEKLRRKGLLERRGRWNPKLAKETPFRGAIQGYVYGLAGTDQAQKRIEAGEGLYSPHAKAVYVEIQKDSRQKRITPYRRIAESLGLSDYETLKAIRVLTEIYPDLVTLKIGGMGFVYDRRLLSEEDVERQVEYWEKRVSKEKLMAGAIGIFHEAYTQKAIDLTFQDLEIKMTFWRRVSRGKVRYDIRLSNGRQIDRVLQVDYYIRGQHLWTHLYPIECKFIKGGVRPEHVTEFHDKLRTSLEFGEEVELREGAQTLRVHVVKQNVYPVFIAPSFTKEARQLAKKLHIHLLPTWILSKLASEKLGKKLRVQTLFKQYMEQGGPIEEFLARAFKKARNR